MRIYRISFRLLIIIIGLSCLVYAQKKESEMLKFAHENISWLGQSGIKIKYAERRIYFDPYKLSASDSADLLLITHDHGDHLSPQDIQKILTPQTILIAPQSCRKSVQDFVVAERVLMQAGDQKEVAGFSIHAVPAYNIKKTRFHPKSKQYLGYVITVGDVTIYHAGDTERIPEMKSIDCDIALLPLGQTYTMDSVEQAAAAAKDVQAKVAIPIHYGLYEGKPADAQTFKELLKDQIQVIIKEY